VPAVCAGTPRAGSLSAFCCGRAILLETENRLRYGGRRGDGSRTDGESMYRPRDAQTSLFTASIVLTSDSERRLDEDWPGQFRRVGLPMIDEKLFSEFYHAENGRPNKAVAIVVGTLLLKEWWDLTDAEALDALRYDLRWRYALDMTPQEAQCCQKTLHNFRAKLMASGKGQLLFDDMVSRIVEAVGIVTERQRLDSTHTISNIARLSRLGLFCETVRVFLKELKQTSGRKFRSVPESLRRRYLKADGKNSSYHDARSTESRRRIAVCARDVWRLVDRFRGEKRIAKLESYGLLQRLFDEQCEVVEEAQTAAEGDADAAEPCVPVVVKEAKQVRSDSMQSPHDPGMTYNAHKGKGCEVQIAETTGNGEKPEIITYAEVTRSCDSDEKATVPVVDYLASRGMQPADLVTDTNYGSTANVIELERKGTELVAPVAGHKPAAEEESAAAADETAPDGRTEAVGESKTGEGAPRPASGREIDKGEFEVDVKGERPAKCPAGRDAVAETCDAGTGKVRLVFGAGACAACPLADRCPAKRRKDGTRVLKTTLHAAVLARRRRHQRTAAFRERYAERAGIEGTNSELKRVHGLGRLRVRGFLRVRLAVKLKALACNVKRMVKYLVEQGRRAAKAAAAGARTVEAAA
jgi:hypothetical protein